MADLSEPELVALARKDPGYFEEIYRRFAGPVGAMIYRRLGDTALTEDLVAETFVIALSALRRYRGRAGLRLWLFGIASHLVNGRIRRLRRDRHLMQRLFAARPQVAAETVSDLQRKEAQEEVRSQLALTRRLILELPPNQQAVLTLCCLEGLSEAEAAASLQIRPGTVKSRLSRGRKRLTRLFSKHTFPEEK